MRKWCAILATGVLFALPLCAQQKDTGTASNSNPNSESNVATPASARDFSIAPASPSLFAMPAAAAGKPADIFSDWANNPWNRNAWGQLTPKFEVAGLFSYINFQPGAENNFNNMGGTGSFAYNANKWIGLVGEFGAYSFKRDIYILPSGATQQVLVTTKGNQQTYLFGPRLNLRRFDHFVPFAEALFGGAHGSPELTGDNSQTAFALVVGGGVDVVLSKDFSWRFFEADYMMTSYSGSQLAASARQNNFRIGSGLVVRWDYPPAPPKPNHPPVAACSAAVPSVYQGSTDPVAIHVSASDPDNDPLTYSYTATGGTVDGNGPDVRWSPSGLALGSYTINVKVDDGRGGTATCAADVAVAKRPNSPPTISCSPERSPIIAGERVAINSHASDPDGDPITYSYAATSGQISGNTATAQYDSTGLAAGSYNITCTADDGRGGRTDAKTTVDVQAPAPPPQASKVGDCGYTKVGAGRFDNACKRVGDDVALRLTNEPNAKLVIIGFADPKEPKPDKLALTRAEGAKKYLGEKGIDASRITTRTGTANTMKGMEKDNRRVDFVFVPEGATY
jgi:Outer membrane protein beta-barrel domain/Bacterial Ig domain